MATDSDQLPLHVPPAVQVSRRVFDMPIDVDRLATEQGVRPLQKLEDLRANFWPEDETADEIVATVRRWRREAPDRSID